MEFIIEITETDNGSCSAKCPELGLFANGTTMESALNKIKNMIVLLTSQDHAIDEFGHTNANTSFIREHSNKIH
ncbi:MAG: hypothetical protein P9M03_01090 [Candidatus Theseobacter exili]|nr:hypothetical protein [Candidatus Theseobacter exili]